MLRMLDLFSGIGGFSLAGRWAGFETVAFCEKDNFCRKVLTKHWPDTVIHHDIKKFSYQHNVDLMTGGFPCQPFSVAGKRKGKEDDRYLWPEFLRIIKECKPAWIVAENVTGIVGMELDNILDDLEKSDYESQPFVIPACAANAPHRRDRVWIIAYSNGKRCDMWSDSRKERFLQNYIEWDASTLQSKWEKLKPKSWATYQAENWFSLNFNSSGSDDGVSSRVDRVKALGNAIVPQVVYPILALIAKIENEIRSS